MGEMMQAVCFHEYGGPEKLVLDKVPRPSPKPSEVLIRMKAAGVNPVDWKIRAGFLRETFRTRLPHIPGTDGAGEIEEVGADVSSLARGEAVFGIIIASYAQYAVAAADHVTRKPTGISFEQAAAVPLGALTAWNAVIEVGDIRADQLVLVLGAAGGVGTFAVQLARWKGAHVVGTASKANAEFVISRGAERVIDYQSERVEEAVRDADVVIDTVGGEALEHSLSSLRRGGTLVTVAGQPPHERAQAYGVRALSAGRASPQRMRDVADLLASGVLVPVVGHVYPLAEARAAHEASQSRHGSGRIVLRI